MLARVHEYGGGTLLLQAQSFPTLLISAFTVRLEMRTQPLTPAADMRYADAIIDRLRSRIICVRKNKPVLRL